MAQYTIYAMLILTLNYPIRMNPTRTRQLLVITRRSQEEVNTPVQNPERIRPVDRA